MVGDEGKGRENGELGNESELRWRIERERKMGFHLL